jgi:uncharacterized iron-regulated membrane protein
MQWRGLKLWHFVHTYSSLVCTVFLLIICLTGLPLIFNKEITHWLDNSPPYAVLPAGTPGGNLDPMLEQSRRLYPDQTVTSVFMDDDEPQVVVYMAPSWEVFRQDPKSNHFLKFDARTGQLIKESDPPEKQGLTFMGIMLSLHTDFFAGLVGELFLGFMSLLFVAAIVSGMVLYGPFMKKLEFGSVRSDRSTRIKWLDLHNLLGIVALAWTLVLGATGVINELATPLFLLWQRTDVQEMLRPYQGKTPPDPAAFSSVQNALVLAQSAAPDMTVISVVYPGSPFGSPHHYMLWAKGRTPLTSRLFSPVLVEAQTGVLAAAVAMPWYLRALEVSRPLHFGDYGGLPLKILWTILDVMTIVILGSGLYLWFARRKSKKARLDKLIEVHAQDVRFQSEKELRL